MPASALNGDAHLEPDAPAPGFTPMNGQPSATQQSADTIEVPLDSSDDEPAGAQDGDDDGDDEEDASEDELADDVDPNAGAHFFCVRDEDRVAPYTVVSRTIKELYDMMRKKEINLRPDYQRDYVWTNTRQQGLIDSLFKGSPIPAVVLSVKEEQVGKKARKTYTCIDGQQRLTTIKRFMAGKIAYKDKLSTRNKQFRFQHMQHEKPHYVVPAKEKAYFESREIMCLEHHDLPETQEHDIFRRIQQGMVLLSGEKASVGNTPRQEFIKELRDQYLSEGGVIASNLKITLARGKNFNNLSAFVLCCDSLPSERAMPTRPVQEAWLTKDTAVPDELRTRCVAALDDLLRIIKDFSDPFIHVAETVAPVEVVFITIYLFITHDAKIPDQTRASEILQMRQEVHREFKGVVNMNSKLFTFLWRQIDRFAAREEHGYERLPYLPDPMPEPSQRKVVKRTKRAPKTPKQVKAPVDQEMESPPASPRAAAVANGASSSRKRAHVDLSTDGDDDLPLTHWSPKKGKAEVPSPIKKKTKLAPIVDSGETSS